MEFAINKDILLAIGLVFVTFAGIVFVVAHVIKFVRH